LKKLGAEFRGVRVEDKTFTAAIHYRQYRGSIRALEKKLKEVIQGWPGTFALKTGKKIFEVYPAVAWNKGRALLKVERLLGYRSAPLVIFFGDDHADEEAFRRMNSKDISVAVGRGRKTAARYFCKNSAEVMRFLELLLKTQPSGKN
jgi:trehalose-phosphatase